MGRTRFMDELMAEPIRLPGVPQVIVTRDFAWQWMKDLGYDPNERGFGSMEYAIFHQKQVSEPLTDLRPLANFLGSVAASIRRDCMAAA